MEYEKIKDVENIIYYVTEQKKRIEDIRSVMGEFEMLTVRSRTGKEVLLANRKIVQEIFDLWLAREEEFFKECKEEFERL